MAHTTAFSLFQVFVSEWRRALLQQRIRVSQPVQLPVFCGVGIQLFAKEQLSLQGQRASVWAFMILIDEWYRGKFTLSRKFALPGEEVLEGAEQNSPSSCFSRGGMRAISVLHPLLFQSVQMHLRIPIKAKAGVTKRVRRVSVLAFRVTRVDDLVDYHAVSS
jgi:hypothetical protein